MSEPFAILLDGDLTVTPRLHAQLAGCRTIAADGAIRHAAPLGLTPELWVGDFDSAQPAERSRYASVPRDTFDRDKDQTDGEIAIEAALSRGAASLVLVGALGKRTDHTLGILLAMVALAARGVPVLATSGAEEAVALTAMPQTIDWPAGTTFSVLALSDLAGLSIAGARWPLTDQSVPLGASLTLSNEATGPVRVAAREGRGLVIAQIAP